MNGLFAIPFILFLAFIWNAIRVYRGWKSGVEVQDKVIGSPTYGQWLPGPGRMIPKGPAVYGAGFLIAAVATFFMIKSDYREQKPRDQKKWDKYKERNGGVGDTSAYDTANYR